MAVRSLSDVVDRADLADALASAAWSRRQALRRGVPTDAIDDYLDTLLDQWLIVVRGQ